MVAYLLPKQRVAGSNPVSRSMKPGDDLPGLGGKAEARVRSLRMKRNYPFSLRWVTSLPNMSDKSQSIKIRMRLYAPATSSE